jgi:molybdopterin/thiamine biosynthesis adenylyltransferase
MSDQNRTTDWDRVERLLGQAVLEHLQQQTVGVIGLGSGGGYVAVALAMTGVQHFVLVDNDVIDEANVVRHVADRRYLGRSKVEAVQDLILARNPAATLTTFQGRIEDNLDLLDGLDLVVVGVDTEVAKFGINAACLERGLTAVYAGVYERGEGGDVVTIRPMNGPCYACWAESLREGYVSPNPDGSGKPLDYGQIREDGTIEAEPGLWLDVVRVANTQANIALNVLLQGTDAARHLPGNTIIMANQALEIIAGQQTEPFSAEWVNIQRNPDCLVCGEYYQQAAAAAETLSLDDLLDRQQSTALDNLEQQQEGDHDD